VDLPFDVAVTAADDRGIGFVEVAFGDQTDRIPGNGQRTVSGVVTFRLRPVAVPSGERLVRAVAIATDGRTTGQPQEKRIMFGLDDARVYPFDREAFENYRDMLSDPGYAQRTGLVLPTGGNIPEAENDPRPWWIRWQTTTTSTT
jgi:hypothetical protein